MKAPRLLWLIPFALLILTLLAAPTAAQSPCRHVEFVLDTGLPLDQTAVCEAAQPWADEGIDVFIYLTDDRPAGEDEWFAQLDQIEATAGIRDLSSGGFDRNTLALEASTTQTADWATTVTIGEALFNTPLDDDTALDTVKRDLADGIQSGNATAAFTAALATAHAITYPAPNTTLINLGIVFVVVGVLLFAGVLLYVPVVKPWLARRKRAQQLREHLGVVQQNVANLLLATERVLSGERVDDAVLYQMFTAYGGSRYPERDQQVREWIRRSQAALADAFDLRRSLLREDVQQSQSLEEQVRSWEMIYLTLVGSSPRIRELTDAELQDLVNPLVILERDAEDVQLAEQLDAIRREIEGMPLKIELEVVDPEQVDAEGILGYVDQVEGQIRELMAAQEAAPGRIDEARAGRLAAEEAADSARPFGMTGSQITAALDPRLTQAQATLDDGLYLNVIAETDAIERDLEIVEDLLEAAADHAGRLALITAVTDAGYRPAQLPDDEREIEADIVAIREHVLTGDYLRADTWIDELDADSQRALEHAQSWRERHQFNVESIGLMRDRLTAVAAYLDASAAPAWDALAAYPPGNWQDITPGLDTERAALADLRDVALPAVETQNSLAVQDIPAAETTLADAGKRLVALERALHALADRLEEVRTAEATLPDGLRLGTDELAQAVTLRDAEDAKIGPEIDATLAEAETALHTAVQHHAERLYFPAVTALTRARKLAGDAYTVASAQVARINQLAAALETAATRAGQQVRRTLGQADKVTPQAATADAAALLQTMNSQYSAARKAQAEAVALQDHVLAAALETAVAAYEQALVAGAEAEQRVQADQRAYDDLRRQARQALDQAENAIERADRAVREPDARGAGREALDRARKALPDAGRLAHASREQLQSLRADADRAAGYAREAEEKARNRINQEKLARTLTWVAMAAASHSRQSDNWSWGSPQPRNSNRAARRSSGGSGGSWGGSFGGSRRSSFGGSSRSSSFGGSRRSASGGSRRR